MTSSSTPASSITLYRRRWFFLFLYFLLNCAMSAVWTGVLNVSSQLEVLYDSNEFKTTQLTNIFYALYVPGTLLSTYLLSRFGVRVTGSVGGLLVTIGSWLRVAAMGRSLYWVQAMATAFAAVGQPCIMNGVSQVSSHWFHERERNLSTMFGETIPAALGGLILGLYVQQSNKPESPADGSVELTPLEFDQLWSYFVTLASIITAISVIYAAFMRDRPPTPPSLVEALHRNDKTSLLSSLQMLRDRNYLMLVAMMNADFGMIAILSGLIEDVTTSNGFSQNQTDAIFASLLGAAILGGIIVAPLADHLIARDVKYCKWILAATNILALVSLVAFTLTLSPSSYYTSLILLSLTSFFWTGAVPVVIETATEIVHPLPEGAATGNLLMIANIFSFITILVFYALRNAMTAAHSVWLLSGLQLIVVGCCFIFVPRFKRRKQELRLSVAGLPPGVLNTKLHRLSNTLEAPLLDVQEDSASVDGME